jgi:diacylglycerol kinase (ATP)
VGGEEEPHAAGHRLEAASWARPPEPIRHRASFATLIVDPGAGHGRVGDSLPVVRECLRRHGFEHREEVAGAPGGALRAAREALGRGERFLVAVGDDATANEVANAMLEDDRPVDPEAVLCVLAANSGCDLVRSFGLSQDPVEAVARMAVGDVYAIDVGRVDYSAGGDRRGGPGGVGDASRSSRYFVNQAQVGLGAAALARADRLPRFLGRGRRFAGYWSALIGYRRPPVTIAGGRRRFEGRVTNVLVANLQYGGEGMWTSPRSWPEDGYLDLQIWTGPRSDSFTLLPRMFQGEHLPNPRIMEVRSRSVRIESERPLWVEADGRPLGSTPATFTVVPRVLRLKV